MPRRGDLIFGGRPLRSPRGGGAAPPSGPAGAPTIRASAAPTGARTLTESVGNKIQVKVAGSVTGVAFWRDATSGLTARRLRVYTGGVLSATSDPMPGDEPGASGWLDAALPVPFHVPAFAWVTVAFDSTVRTATGASPDGDDPAVADWSQGLHGSTGGEPTVADVYWLNMYSDLWFLPD